MTAYEQGLLLRWHSMNFSPERQPNSEPKAEDNYKSRTMNVTPGTADEQRTTADFIPSASVEANPLLPAVPFSRRDFPPNKALLSAEKK